MAEIDDVVPFQDPMHNNGPVRPGARRRAAVMLVVATLYATAIGAVIFWAVLSADFLTGAASSVNNFLFSRPAIAMTLACSPLFAAMLVGYGYMQRAMRRRRDEKRKALAEEAAAA